MNHILFLSSFVNVLSATLDQEAAREDIAQLNKVLSNYQHRNGLPQQKAGTQWSNLIDQYNPILISVENEGDEYVMLKDRPLTLTEFVNACNNEDPEQLMQSDIEDILMQPKGGKVFIGDITVTRIA